MKASQRRISVLKTRITPSRHGGNGTTFMLVGPSLISKASEPIKGVVVHALPERLARVYAGWLNKYFGS